MLLGLTASLLLQHNLFLIMYWLDIICLPLQVYPLPISVPQETVWSEQTGSLMLQLPTGFSQRKAPAGGRNKKRVNKDWLHPSLIQSQEASPQSSPSTAAGDRFFSCPFRTSSGVSLSTSPRVLQ